MEKTVTWFGRFRDGLAFTLPLTLILGGLLFWQGPAPLLELQQGSLLRPVKLDFPVAAALDAHDNAYVIDHGSRRLVSLTADGQLRWTLDGGKRENGLYEFYRLAALPEGGVLVYNALLDPADASLEAEQIVKIDDLGRFAGVLVEKRWPKDQRGSDEQRIGSLYVRPDGLYYLFKNGGKTSLNRLPLDGLKHAVDPASHQQVFSAEIDLDSVSVAPAAGGLYVAERRGRLFWIEAKEGSAGTVSVPAFALDAGRPVFEKPWDLKVSAEGHLFVLDNFTQTVFRAAGGQPVTKMFDSQEVLALGRQKPFFEAIDVGSSGSLAVVDKFNHSVFVVHEGEKTRVLSECPRPLPDSLLKLLVLAGELLFFPAAALALVGLVRRLLARRTSLMLKQVALFLPLVVISVSLGAAGIYQLMDASFRKQLDTKLALMASLGAKMIDGDLVRQITRAADFDSPAHQKLGQQVNVMMNGYQDPWMSDLRAVVYKYDRDTFYFVKNYSAYYGVMFPYGGATRAHFAAARGGSLETTIYSDEYGSYLSGLAPLKAADGTITGVLEIYHNWSTISELAEDFGRRLILAILWSVTTVVLLLALANFLLFLSLSFLRRASQRLAKGEMGILVQSRRRDEIGDLAQDFNTMSQKLKEHFTRLQEIRDANARFVPTGFLSFLGKASIADVESGDQSRQRMTVFFSDIRSFTSLSEGLTPKENFDFVNSYLSLMGPVIRDHGGFIDRYLGDAIMAIFPESPAAAVRAGLAMREKLNGFNAERRDRGLPEVAFGVGIHTANLILGVVGEKNRLSVTVISEAVDLVNQLEASTKTYHVGMVFTETVWADLSPELKKAATALDRIDFLEDSLQLYGI